MLDAVNGAGKSLVNTAVATLNALSKGISAANEMLTGQKQLPASQLPLIAIKNQAEAVGAQQ